MISFCYKHFSTYQKKKRGEGELWKRRAPQNQHISLLTLASLSIIFLSIEFIVPPQEVEDHWLIFCQHRHNTIASEFVVGSTGLFILHSSALSPSRFVVAPRLVIGSPKILCHQKQITHLVIVTNLISASKWRKSMLTNSMNGWIRFMLTLWSTGKRVNNDWGV